YMVADDGGLFSNIATVTVTVQTNQPPVAVDDTASAISGNPITINVVANDTEPDDGINPNSVAIVSAPANGTATVDPSTGLVTYTSDAGFTGTDTFRYTVQDALGAVSNQATVTIIVRASILRPGFDTTTFLPNDDGTYPANGPETGVPPGTPVAQPLGFGINFLGLSFTQVFINNNGNVTFDSPLSEFTPFNLTDT